MTPSMRLRFVIGLVMASSMIGTTTKAIGTTTQAQAPTTSNTRPMQTPPAVQTPATTVGGTAVPCLAFDYGTANALLDRMQQVLDDSLSDKPKSARSGIVGTSGNKVGQVSVDRSTFDEFRAEVVQLKVMLQDKNKP